MDELLNPQTEELLVSTGSRKTNHEYQNLPNCIKHQMTEKEWLWNPNKSGLIEEFCDPEVAEDG